LATRRLRGGVYFKTDIIFVPIFFLENNGEGVYADPKKRRFYYSRTQQNIFPRGFDATTQGGKGVHQHRVIITGLL